MAHLYGSSGDEAKDMEAKEALLESSLEQAFAEYDFARKHQMPEPVVFLVDCEDQIGSPMARGWEGDEAVDAAIQENREEADEATAQSDPPDAQRCITTLARAFALADCRREIPQYFPELMPTFVDEPPKDGFLAVVITAGGAATFTVPFDARP